MIQCICGPLNEDLSFPVPSILHFKRKKISLGNEWKAQNNAILTVSGKEDLSPEY